MIGDLTVGTFKQRHDVIKPVISGQPAVPDEPPKLQLPNQQNAHNNPIYHIRTHYLTSLASGLYRI